MVKCMPRIDYDVIKRKFAEFVKTWRTHDVDCLDQLVYHHVSCSINVAPESNDSLQYLEGLKRFVEDYPRTDVLQLAIYNYSCRHNTNEAQQCGHVICESLNYV